MKKHLKAGCLLAVLVFLSVLAGRDLTTGLSEEKKEQASPTQVMMVSKKEAAPLVLLDAGVYHEEVRPARSLEKAEPMLAAGSPEENPKREQAPRFVVPTIDRRNMNAVYEFLKSRDIPAGVTRPLLHSIKNNILNELCVMNPPPAGLTQALVDAFQDKQQDAVVRDYIIQHLGSPWYAQAPVSEREAIRDVLVEALDETSSSIGGTALLALERLSQNHEEIDREAIKQRALHIATDERAGVLAKIAAVQLCGKMGVSEIIPLARRLSSNSTSFTLRMAATATLADLGEVSTADTERLARAVNTAPCIDCD